VIVEISNLTEARDNDGKNDRNEGDEGSRKKKRKKKRKTEKESDSRVAKGRGW